mmetsp:Transcript_22694/g.41093  ORF Transcript_22694/g.41093 Transcript_22694/m.41093 type:complete len:393 (-) Transcript_22694:90-1268(-)|eukprot:CAMPEP_0197662070 /NCGR_PEP_ID=MMETSP1338-20131121/52044_1 /TAXON_ID=43686 ORGANISM="Pelagodinium beii, Strain RCC1491" /NCGR_SAMPLE_ID=MMETSP1338 /ASSEMBLY_ACC=CAM_ASM_000754 /LENGTH=392 /DNA_ID=CAMNT_0043239771 /DNA_START=16 /DNA_END=1194 /DNA_ORIENTATION=-
MNLLDYDSDGDEEILKTATGLKKPVDAAPKAAEKAKEAEAEEAEESEEEEEHGPFCNCSDCEQLMLRFMAKNLQTKGIRFKCKLSGELFNSKAAAAEHFKVAYAADLQDFKKQKNPKLFQSKPTKEQIAAAARKQSFSRDDVLKKRPIDEDASFGGWAKKEKPAPAPCETEEYQQMMEADVFVAPPWAGQQRPTDDDATEMDKDFDRRIQEAQATRFARRNILEVNKEVTRCKLCYKTLPSPKACEQHIKVEHQDDFKKEIKIWERFLFATCKRQPPFGWVCKICNIFFPSDGATWRHVGKEVFIRLEERHITSWSEKEDRWGHEEDDECCGDGMNVGRLSYDSVMQMNRATALEEQAKLAQGSSQQKEQESSSSSDSEPEGGGKVVPIKEF